jgi:hypothetical protein
VQVRAEASIWPLSAPLQGAIMALSALLRGSWRVG